ncbi:unnamed protein product [Nezara viridula]|uniref:Uncharacterized protein n=1 Tax=Nezara viridula TaxID=85310 RepID=A0A9P0E2S4_NEZVI|nr:unnamed protein product [Nezara viridula]
MALPITSRQRSWTQKNSMGQAEVRALKKRKNYDTTESEVSPLNGPSRSSPPNARLEIFRKILVGLRDEAVGRMNGVADRDRRGSDHGESPLIVLATYPKAASVGWERSICSCPRSILVTV